MFTQNWKLSARIYDNLPSQTKYTNSKGQLTGYALALGYVEMYSIAERDAYVKLQATKGIGYIVIVADRDATGENWTMRFPFPTLTAARARYEEECKELHDSQEADTTF